MAWHKDLMAQGASEHRLAMHGWIDEDKKDGSDRQWFGCCKEKTKSETCVWFAGLYLWKQWKTAVKLNAVLPCSLFNGGWDENAYNVSDMRE